MIYTWPFSELDFLWESSQSHPKVNEYDHDMTKARRCITITQVKWGNKILCVFSHLGSSSLAMSVNKGRWLNTYVFRQLDGHYISSLFLLNSFHDDFNFLVTSLKCPKSKPLEKMFGKTALSSIMYLVSDFDLGIFIEINLRTTGSISFTSGLSGFPEERRNNFCRFKVI